MQKHDWSQVFPIQSIEDDFLIGGVGEITIGWRVMMPEVYTMSQKDGEDIHENLVNSIKLLPVDTVFHKQDFYYPDRFSRTFEKGNQVEKSKIINDNGRPLLRHYSNIYVSFNLNKRQAKAGKNIFLSPKDYIFQKPFKNAEKLIREYKNSIETFENSLQSIKGVKTIRMDNNALGAALYDYFNLSYDNPLNEDYHKQLLQPLTTNGEMKIGNNYIKMITLYEEGERVYAFDKSKAKGGGEINKDIELNANIELKSSMNHAIGIGLPVKHIVNTIIKITDNDTIKTALDIEARKLNPIAAIGHPGAQNKKADIESFISTVEKYGYQACKLSVNVIMDDSDLEKLNTNTGYAQAAFKSINNAKCRIENEETAINFFASAPGNASANHNEIITNVDAAVCYINKEAHYYSDPSGHIYYDRFTNPVVVNIWDSPYTVNRNKIVIGPSGSGKSFWLNGYINQSLAQESHICIVDIGHSYKRNCELNRGRYFDSSDKKNLSFNIFLCEKDNQGNYIYQGEDDEAESRINFIYSVLATIWRKDEPVKQEEKAILKNMIKAFYDHINKNNIFPDMKAFFGFIDVFEKHTKDKYAAYFDYQSFRLLLEPYVEGEMKHLLNARDNIDIVNDKFVVFDLEAIQGNKDLFAIVSSVIIELVVQKTKKLKGVRKELIIDEGLDFLEDEKMGDFIGYLYRTFRKKEGSVCLAAQNITFLASADQKVQDSIKINTDTKILLNHKNYKASYPDLQQYLSLTDYDIEMLDSIEGFEFFIKQGNHTRIFKNIATDYEEAVYTSKQKDVQEIEKYFDKYGSLHEAINEFIEQKKQKVQ